ncbi:PEST proteolytic signal-containing nuclear protein-like isoform X2 [Limulus polyphemus]|uniref:PEST proteolytic signal-containing nuclear protein n=1 Tax=Limulus polyphemus TaxID=6850 RepID=A0ABM1B7Z0_LIMPO|nr:PEST proteolytic signal-containing nuclear protein-like isoform X2 [Limulus polyphemus]
MANLQNKDEGSDDLDSLPKIKPNTEPSRREDEQPSAVEAEKRKLGEEGDKSGEENSATKKQKISMGFTKSFNSAKFLQTQDKKNPMAISIKLGMQKPKEPPQTLKKTSASVAEVFNQDSDDDEEMPPEAKMRMRNLGRDTPTSAGPNSYGKTRQGFCDMKKVFERQLKEKMDEISNK